MKHTFISSKDIYACKAKMANLLFAELCDMKDMVMAGTISADVLKNHWHALKEVYNLEDFFEEIEKELDEQFPTALTPECNKYYKGEREV